MLLKDFVLKKNYLGALQEHSGVILTPRVHKFSMSTPFEKK